MARRDVSLSIAIILFAIGFTTIRVMSRVRWKHRASGSVRVDGTSAGSYGFSVEDCKRVGEAAPDSYSADLIGSDGHGMRVVRAGNALQLSLYPKRGGPGSPIDAQNCSQWDVMFHWEDPATMNLVGGNLNINCSVDGGKIDGLVSFGDCRP